MALRAQDLRLEKSFMSALQAHDVNKENPSPLAVEVCDMRPVCYALAWALVAGTWADAAGPLLPFKKPDPVPLPASIPWHEIDDRCRERILPVVEKATLAGQGPAESFTCVPQQYLWLLDHPDRAVGAWRRLGAKCVSIAPRRVSGDR